MRRFLVGWERLKAPVSSYVVIDDGPGPLPDERRLVKTSGAIGITTQDIEMARRVLLGADP